MTGTTPSGVSYQIVGNGEPAFVFVHGFACAGSDWAAQVAALSPNHRCVTLDLPGHGVSAALASPTLAGLGSAVNDVRRAAGVSQAILVGHSLGAKVIREAYSEDPEGIAGLVLIDGAFYDGDRETMLGRASALIDAAGFAAYQQAHFGSMFGESSDGAFREHVVARAAGLDPAYGRALYLEAVTWDPARGQQTLRQIKVPTLVLQSTQIGADLKRQPVQAGTKTSFMRMVEELVPGAQSAAVAGVGHFTMNEAPEEVNRHLQAFVARVAGSEGVLVASSAEIIP
jgi:pimeloyl-ACP methyl ester carboxylesterase